MVKHITISASVKGAERQLLQVQERSTSQDLTIVVKSTVFRVSQYGARGTENDRVVEARYSVHCSPSSDRTNGIKFTQILADRRRHNTYNYTEAIKVHNQFAIVFVRRSGDLSDDRYIINNTGGPIIKLGPYDPAYFQLVYMVLVSAPDRHFVVPTLSYINCLQYNFSRFRLVILWQFMCCPEDDLSTSRVPKTFHQNEIEQESDLFKKYAKERMRTGVSENHAVALFTMYKYRLAHSIIDAHWDRMSVAEKQRHATTNAALKALDMYVSNGTAFSDEHIDLLRRVDKFRSRRERKRTTS